MRVLARVWLTAYRKVGDSRTAVEAKSLKGGIKLSIGHWNLQEVLLTKEQARRLGKFLLEYGNE